jgi:hypothetical protein
MQLLSISRFTSPSEVRDAPPGGVFAVKRQFWHWMNPTRYGQGIVILLWRRVWELLLVHSSFHFPSPKIPERSLGKSEKKFRLSGQHGALFLPLLKMRAVGRIHS